MPERFDLTYVGADNNKHRPIMIHRALLGSLERFIGILIEHYGGRFPVWLAPVQAIIAPISHEQLEYCEKLRDRMLAEELRPEIDARGESIGYRIRDAISKKAPFICVAGQKELEEHTISVRRLGENKSESMPLEDFLTMIKEKVKNKQS
jgi:threonyl-tRNA synthetase